MKKSIITMGIYLLKFFSLAEASQINHCLEVILDQKNIKIENEKQIECLIVNKDFNEAPLILCDQEVL